MTHWKRPAYTGDTTTRTTEEALRYEFSDYTPEQLGTALATLIGFLYENEKLRKIQVTHFLRGSFERVD